MTSPAPLSDDQGAPVRRITMTRPKSRNALSLEAMRALLDAFTEAGGAPGVKAIILAAEGPVFCAGHDLKEIEAARTGNDQGAETFAELFRTCSDLMLAIMKCPVPIIAEVQGMATAAGCQLVATCDMAVAADGAQFATPGVNIGLFCSTPMVALSRNVPRKAAMEMLTTGAPIDAAEAQRIGLINRVVPAADLTVATNELAAQVASKPGAIMRIGKDAFYRQLNMGVEDAYRFTAEVMTANLLHKDAAEGIAAFVEKRNPKWSDS